MKKNFTYLGLAAAIALTACASTQQQSPISNQAGTYSSGASQSYAQSNYANNNASTQQDAYQACLRRETNRELIGGAVGGTAGAFVGKELIGGTTGVIAGAALGGAAGYGAGNLSTTCVPPQTQGARASYQSQGASAGYQSAPTTYAATPARFSSVSCPVGTAAQPNGTCLLQNTPAPVQSRPLVASQASSFQQFERVPQNESFVRTNAFMSPSPFQGTEVTRQRGGSNYQVKPGDTVYSLARSRCVPVTEIQGTNGLDSNFGIKIGQGLQLPSSQC